MVAMSDEQKIIDRLPTFVSTDPDKMPSIKLTEGDLSVVLLKLAKINDSIVEVQRGVVNTDANVSRLIVNHNHQPATNATNASANAAAALLPHLLLLQLHFLLLLSSFPVIKGSLRSITALIS